MAKNTVQIRRFKVMTSCARDLGIKPGQKWSKAARAKVESCMAKKARSK
jgi:hypothetical protein